MAASGTVVRALTLLVAAAPLCVVTAAEGVASAGEPAAGAVQLVSKAPSGERANQGSYDPKVSADGSVVAYSSSAKNLTDDPQNAYSDVFLWDRVSDTTKQVSQGLSGAAPDGSSFSAAVTADGSYVVFASYASNLVAEETNGLAEIFVYEAATEEISLVSGGLDGAQPNKDILSAQISDDGRYVVFESGASNLVVGDTNRKTDVFLVDRSTGSTTRVSVGQDGEQLDGGSNFPVISGNGEYIAVQSAVRITPDDLKGFLDIFVYSRKDGEVELLSATPEGTPGLGDSTKPSISQDGMTVAFESRASDLVSDDGEQYNDIFVRDRTEQVTTLINRKESGKIARGRCNTPAISADGAHVAYISEADDLVPGLPYDFYNGLFAYDASTGVNTLVNHRLNGKAPQQGAGFTSGISDDGTYVSFSSTSKHLVESPRVRYESVFLSTATP